MMGKSRAKLLQRAKSKAYLKTESEYFDRLFKASKDYHVYLDLADALQLATDRELEEYLGDL